MADSGSKSCRGSAGSFSCWSERSGYGKSCLFANAAAFPLFGCEAVAFCSEISSRSIWLTVCRVSCSKSNFGGFDGRIVSLGELV